MSKSQDQSSSKVWGFLAGLGFAISSIISLILLFNKPLQDQLVAEIGDNLIMAFLIIFILSFLATAFAPLSTTIIVYALILVWDWRLVLVAAILGNMLGYAFGFWVARIYRDKVFHYFPWLSEFMRWKRVVETSRDTVHLFFFRFVTLYVGDYLSFVAGLTKVDFLRFMIVSFVADAIYKLVIFYYIHITAGGGNLAMLVLGIFVFGAISWALYTIFERRTLGPRSEPQPQ